MRDCRITTIYEGTTGIQANDLIGRKIARDSSTTVKALIVMMQATHGELVNQSGGDFTAIADALGRGITALQSAVDYVVANFASDVRAVSVGAVPFLNLMGTVSGGWIMARSALIAHGKITAGISDPFYAAKLVTARYYADHAMSAATGLASEVVNGGASGLSLAEELF